MSDLPEIEVKAMPQEDAEAAFGISKWGTWGCGVSKFDWEYSGKETAYVLEGHVIVTPTGAWSECKPAEGTEDAEPTSSEPEG